MSKLSLKRSLRFSIVIFLGSLLVVTLYLDYRRDEGIRHYLDMTTAAQDIAWQAAINLHRNSVETEVSHPEAAGCRRRPGYHTGMAKMVLHRLRFLTLPSPCL